MQQKAGLLRLIGSSNAAKTSLLAMSVLSDYIASKGLLRYDQLSPAAQVVAQDTTLADQEAAYRRQLSAAREALATSSLHSRINDRTASRGATGIAAVAKGPGVSGKVHGGESNLLLHGWPIAPLHSAARLVGPLPLPPILLPVIKTFL